MSLRTQITEALEKDRARTTNHSYNGVYNCALDRAISEIHAVLDREPSESPVPATPESPCQGDYPRNLNCSD